MTELLIDCKVVSGDGQRDGLIELRATAIKNTALYLQNVELVNERAETS